MNRPQAFGVFLFGVVALGTTALGMERVPEDEGEQPALAAADPSISSPESDGEEASCRLVALEAPDYEKIAGLLKNPGETPFSMEELLAPLTIQTRAVLSPKQAYWLSRVLGALALRVDRDVPLQTARTIESLSYDVDNTNPIALIDMDRLLFFQACLTGEIAIALVHESKDQSTRLDAFEQCDRACRGFKDYIAFNKKHWSPLLRPVTRENLEMHGYLAHEKRARLSLERHVVCRQERSLENRLEDVAFTIENIREALAQSFPKKEFIGSIPKQFLSLVQSYCHQAILCEEGADRAGFERSLKLAKTNLKELAKNKKKDEYSHKAAQAHIEACEEQKRILDAVNRGGKGKIADLRRRNFLNMPSKIQEPLSKLFSFKLDETLDEKRRQLRAFLNEDRGSKTGSAPEDSIARILELEAWIAQDSRGDPKNLLGIYQYSIKQEGATHSRVMRDLMEYALFFVKAGRLEEASQRAAILALLNPQKTEPEYSLGRYIWALAENLRGNFEPLLALQEKIECKKKAKKERQRNKTVENAKEAIEATQKEQAAKAAQAEQSNRKEPKRLQRLQTASAGSPSALVYFEPVLSPQEEKEARQARHQAAEESRANQVSADAENSSASEGSVAPQTPLSSPRSPREEREAVLQKVLSEDSTPINALYSLRGVAAQVEREISANTWKFNRKEFDTYLEALGCTQSRMRGSHKTISLPTISCIKQGETVVMVLTQEEDDSLDFESTSDGSPAIQQAFGGSLTLPPWDSKHVPLYLQKQILSARESLRAFGLLARKNQPAAAKNLG